MKLFAGNMAYLQFYLSNFTDTRSLEDAVRNIPYCDENTNTTGALRLTRTKILNTANGDRPDVPNVIVLLTDGNPTWEADLLSDEVDLIKSLGIRIVGVGVTNEASDCSLFVHSFQLPPSQLNMDAVVERVCVVHKSTLCKATMLNIEISKRY